MYKRQGVSRLPQRGGIMQAAQMDRREWQHATVYLNWSRRLQCSKNRNKAGGDVYKRQVWDSLAFGMALAGGYCLCLMLLRNGREQKIALGPFLSMGLMFGMFRSMGT